MGYNRQQKMKKVLFSMAMIAMIAAGTLMLSAFNTPKQEENTDCSQIAMNDDEWTIIRENVDFCAQDKDGNWACVGRGNVRANQKLQMQINGWASVWYDLTLYDGEKGYNMRFWNGHLNKYCYVYINGL